MPTFQRVIKLSLFFMVVLLPLWLTIARGFLGIGGLETIGLVVYMPIVIGALLLLAILVPTQISANQTRVVSPLDAVLLAVLYLSIFLYGFFMVDVDGTQEKIASAASLMVGPSFTDLSSRIADFFLKASFVLAAACFAVFIYERILLLKKRLLSKR